MRDKTKQRKIPELHIFLGAATDKEPHWTLCLDVTFLELKCQIKYMMHECGLSNIGALTMCYFCVFSLANF